MIITSSEASTQSVRARLTAGQTESAIAIVPHEGPVGLEVPDLSPSTTVSLLAARDAKGTFKPVYKHDWTGELQLGSGAGDIMLPLPTYVAKEFSVFKVKVGDSQGEDKDFWFVSKRKIADR